MEETVQTDTEPRATTSVRARVFAALGALLAAALLVGVASLQVGSRPEPVDAGLPTAPPPLALPSDEPEDSTLARAAAQLAAGDLDEARRGFVDVVAEDQDGVPGQVGLILSQWRTTGPRSVERDLTQLVREYPEDALAALHLGLVHLLLDDPRAARASLRSALELGREAGDPTSLRMSLLADDLLHPDAFSGTLPLLVQPAEVGAADRERVAGLVRAVSTGDRRQVGELGRVLGTSRDPYVAIAVAASAFDKETPEVAVGRLDALAADPDLAAAARDRARLMSVLATLWGGGVRAEGCTRLAALATPRTDPGTSRLARPIRAELCKG